jgi:alpha-1,6-mannosyltransferase
MKAPPHFGFLIRCAILLLLILSLHLLPSPPVVGYATVFLISSMIYLWIARDLLKITLAPSTLIALSLLAILVRLSFTATPPIGSDDVYRYIWEGKVQASGNSPYLYRPDAEELRHLHSSLLPSAVNHPEMKTVYFPLTQWVFFLCYQIGGESVWSLKLALLLAETLTIIGLLRLTTLLGIPASSALLYALCPLPILQFAVDAHIDGLGLPLLVFGLLSYQRNKRVMAFTLIGLSLSVKPVALVFLPLLWFLEKGTWGKMKAVMIPVLVLTVQFIPYLRSSNPFEALSTFSQHWTFNGAIFEVLNLYFADNQRTRLICAFLLGIAVLLLWFRNRSFWDRLYYSVLFLLLFSPVVHPWYVTWLVALLPVTKRWSGVVFAAMVSFTVFTIITYQLDGIWKQYPVAMVIEYVPVFVVLARELVASPPQPSNQVTGSQA